jgi:hypothetical protein
VLTLTRRIPRPSVALGVAFVALFAALGGTGYAALKITGKEIANGTVTGADVENKSLGSKELKPDTLGGDQIKESALGTVPEAAHAAGADNAINAQTAAKAADADAVGGIPAAQLMTVKTRAYETTIPAVADFPSGATLRTLSDLPPGTYVVTARLSYHNPGASGQESCTLEVPGSNDVATFTVEAVDTETISLTEVTSSGSVFGASVNCTSDGTDDLEGTGTIVALRVD